MWIKISGITFHESSFSGSQVGRCGQMDEQTERWTDGHAKASRHFTIYVNMPKGV
jgi:hypothetical protein